ncbi:ABC transporter permease/substrate-binding protein [Enterococcus faecium]|uniref:ABC transporter permease subunit n=1 Tax=Enterococcus faecium TaxID=1352 RepID=A0A7V7GLE3_ENTFC|nr:ABC transporter permease/substrate-binding protein [Enterococcus faecium]KAA0689615.1 ABC transporter permease subunit [Enterococcus faecium]MBK5027760.1 ABC transporter permease/substrate-binding protein [Enterococcus faecium]MBK5038560.1 ABC transporter permease/substrate-binding protein [Enterococcus faecium]MBK5043554.1 ABC transporter permease/substrate-binding protein [Enterococcus faecium]MBK5068425.1 ABC transporter permease/substrate-binding protein [Enterococcus faecium]
MNNFIQTLSERKGELLEAAFQHLSISLISLLIAALIAIPLAIWAANHKKMAEVLLQITGVLQTIPSLALLGLLIPFVGIGTVPALIALVIYALLPIFQNTYIGLAEIDPSIEEAAVAFGMSRMRRLMKVELPIALPVIISGIRTALVLIIGTATLAALIGAGGLGTFILLGIDRNTPVLTLIGAISSALLAIIFSGLIRWLQHKKPRYSIITLAAVVCLVGGVSLYQSALFKNETITIAGKLGAEPEILIQMYKELIEDNTKTEVELKPNFGKTSFLFNALDQGQIDIYPEFTGTVLESLVKVPEAMKSADLTKEKTYDEAEELLNKQFDMTLLKPMAYQNTYALAVKKSFADEHQLKKISDLAAVSNQIKAGFTLEFIDRSDGYKGIQEAYGLNFSSVQSMEPSLRYQAINNGDVNIVDAYSTDSQLKEYDLVTLEDDQGLFPAYQGAPLMKTDFAKDHPEIVEALNKLSGKITENQMINMNYQVNVEKKKPAEVARTFLENEGLLKEGDQ